MNNLRREMGKSSGRKREYLEERIISLKGTIRTKILVTCIRGINEFEKGYQPRTNLAKDKNGDMLENPYNILNIWKINSVSY
jgi:hypothetical protein